MKARTITGWVFGMAVASGAIFQGMAQDALESSQPAVSATNAASAPPALTNNSAGKSRSSATYASPWVDEVERLTKAGVDDGVIVSYVINSAGTFNLTADQIVRLKNIGVSPQVVNAMIQHDPELISGARPLTASPPALPTAFQAALAANPSPASATTTLSAAPAVPSPAPAQIVANDDNTDGDWIEVEPDDVPDQPANLGPVRVPYPVKLNDPIVILRLPTFSVPCW